MNLSIKRILHKDIGFQSDARGESISEKNGLYCELTALYWAWENLPGDAIWARPFGFISKRMLDWNP